jgi:hypothetical protein
MNWDNVSPFAPAVLKLLTGPVYSSNKEWNMLLKFKPEIIGYFEMMAIELLVFEEEGFAYLSQPRFNELEEDVQIFLKQRRDIEHLPVIIFRKQLSDEQTLLCLLLREKYDEVDDRIISKPIIYGLLQDFYKESLNRQKDEKHFNQLVEQVIGMGFLTNLNVPGSEEFYKIEPLIKAKIDLDKIIEIKERLIKHYGEEQS